MCTREQEILLLYVQKQLYNICKIHRMNMFLNFLGVKAFVKGPAINISIPMCLKDTF